MNALVPSRACRKILVVAIILSLVAAGLASDSDVKYTALVRVMHRSRSDNRSRMDMFF